MPENEKDIHDAVADAYEKALELAKAQQGGCCGGATNPCAEAVKSAGYEAQQEKYGDALGSSFGCGNPLAFARVEKGQTVVDLGSGAGLDLLIAADKVGTEGRVIGVDMTGPMIEEARAAARRAGHENIEVREGLIESLPVEDDSADWVISNCVINLSPEKQRVFAEIHRVLRPGGHVSISDIVCEDLPTALRESAAAYAACIGGAISEAEYVAGLEAAGLEDVEVTERLVYDAEQIRAMVGNDLAAFGVDPKTFDGMLSDVEGKAWSARFVARKPL